MKNSKSIILMTFVTLSLQAFLLSMDTSIPTPSSSSYELLIPNESFESSNSQQEKPRALTAERSMELWASLDPQLDYLMNTEQRIQEKKALLQKAQERAQAKRAASKMRNLSGQEKVEKRAAIIADLTEKGIPTFKASDTLSFMQQLGFSKDHVKNLVDELNSPQILNDL